MILLWMLMVLLAGGAAAWALAQVSPNAGRWTALLAAGAFLGLALRLWSYPLLEVPFPGCWQAMVNWPWIPQLGIRFHLMADGISILLLLLTGVVGLLAIGVSWTGITERVGFFHFNLLWTMAGIAGVFMALDLILFYVFWEMMLIPLFFLIVIWGREQRRRAAIKFLLYTQAGSLVLLLGILGLCFAHYRGTGLLTFNYFALLHEPLAPALGFWLMLAFFIGFAVKLPVVGVHGWLPDAHSQAPAAGSVFLAGLALKVGAYGLLRFTVPLFPQAAFAFAPVALVLAVAGILYGAVLAYGQRDLKRLIACSSISHMGFVLLGIFCWNELALQGALLVMLAHGVSTAALFAVADMLHRRSDTYDLERMGGLWAALPRLGGATLILVLATLGLPGLANFIGEFLVLLGAWQAHPTLTVIAACGLVLSAIYALKLVQAVFHGPAPGAADLLPDAGRRERLLLGGAIALLIWFGLNPGPLLRTSGPALRQLESDIRQPAVVDHEQNYYRTPPDSVAPTAGGGR